MAAAGKRWRGWCLLVLVAAWSLPSARAALPVLEVAPGQSEQALAGLWVIADPQAGLDPEPVRAGRHDAAGELRAGASVSLGYPRHPYWLRFQLRNPGAAAVDGVLVMWRGSKLRQDVWIDGGGVDASRALAMGPGRPAASGDVTSRHTVLRLRLPPGAERTLTVRIDSRFSTHVEYRWMPEPVLAAHEWRDQAMFGGVAGFGLAIGGFVLLLGLRSREPGYLWFALSTLCTVIYMLSFEGSLGPLYQALGLSEQAMRVLSGGAGIVSIATFVLFVRGLLDTSRLHPRIDRRLLRPLVALGLLLWALVLIWPAPFTGLVAVWALLSVLLCGGAMLYVAARHGLQLPGFMFSTALYLAVTAVYVLQLMGSVPDHPWIHMLRLGSLCFCLLMFAFAVSEKLRRNREAQQAAIRRNEERLEQMVQRRTAELSESKQRAEQALSTLQGAQVELVAAEKMASLGQLVAGVAHEINTPLGVALTASSHLGEQTREFSVKVASGSIRRSELERYTETAAEASRLLQVNLDRAAELVRSFKQVSVDRTSDGRREFELGEFIKALLDSLSPSWKRRPLRIEVDCPPGLRFDSFPGALGQVLTNLVQNALVHAFPDGRAGVLSLHARSLDDDQVELGVGDDGAGIADEHQSKLFEPFFTTRRGQGGTGLGLHIAFNLVTQKLGGSLQVHSTPGQGSRFLLRLPRRAP